ncbi:MAG: ABC transporter substrate-binding protein [Pseudomonadota bacterium]
MILGYRFLVVVFFGLFAALPGFAAEVGVSDGKILLGQTATFIGQAAELGIGMNRGATAYFNELNAQGGVLGRKIELLKDDDNYEPGMAAENTTNFIEKDKVFALFGYVGTATTNAALPLLAKAKTPLFAPLTGAPSLRDPVNHYVLNVRASIFDETEHIIQQLSTTGIKTIAVFYQSDADGKAGLQGVERALKKFTAVRLVETVGIERNSMELGNATTKLLAKKPEAIIQISSYTSCAMLIKEMRKEGYAGQFYNVSFVGSRALSNMLGADGRGVVISQVVPSPWSTRIAVVRDYQKAMRKAGHKDYDFTSLEGYIAAKTFAEIARRAGHDLTREKFINTAETTGRIDLGDFWVTFTPNNHGGSRFVELVIIGKDGTFVR